MDLLFLLIYFKKLQYFFSSTNSSPECFVICVLCFRGARVSLSFEVGGLVVEWFTVKSPESHVARNQSHVARNS